MQRYLPFEWKEQFCRRKAACRLAPWRRSWRWWWWWWSIRKWASWRTRWWAVAPGWKAWRERGRWAPGRPHPPSSCHWHWLRPVHPWQRRARGRQPLTRRGWLAASTSVVRRRWLVSTFSSVITVVLMIGIATGHWALLCQRPRLHFGIGNRSVVGTCLGASVIITSATAATSAAAAATTVVAFPLRKRKEINRYTLVMRSKRTNAKAGTRSMDVDSCVNADIVAMTFSDISCCYCCYREEGREALF